jgi:hypothetical protein
MFLALVVFKWKTGEVCCHEIGVDNIDEKWRNESKFSEDAFITTEIYNAYLLKSTNNNASI